MKNILLTFVIGALVIGCGTSSKKPSWSDSDFELRSYKVRKLDNGLQVLLVKDKSLPSFSMGLLLKVGYSSDPKGQTGLTSFVNNMLSKGTSKRSAEEVASALDQIGASFDVETHADFTWIESSTLSYYSGELAEVFAEILSKQRFAQKEVDRLRSQKLSAIRRRVDDPSSFASYAFNQFLMSGHPYANSSLGSRKDVRKIRRKHIIKHYFKHYRPNNAILTVTGKYPSNIMGILEEKFSGWKKGNTKEKAPLEIDAIKGKQILVVNKPDLVQTQIRLGHFGIKRSNPDYLRLRVANTILGSGFGSRLMERIRVQLGLTYSVNSSFAAREDRGPFTVMTFTKNKTAGKAIKESLNVIKTFHDKGVTDLEVESAKSFIMGLFPQAIETSEKLAFNLAILRFYGISDDYLEDFQKNVGKMTTAEVNSVVKKYFDPENVRILAYTRASSVMPQLKGIGKVKIKGYREIR